MYKCNMMVLEQRLNKVNTKVTDHPQSVRDIPLYKSDVCLFSSVLFRTTGGPLGPAGRVMKYLQRKTEYFLFEVGGSQTRLPECQTSSARLSPQTDRNTKRR